MLQFGSATGWWPRLAQWLLASVYLLALSCCSHEGSSSNNHGNNNSNKPQSQLGRPTDSTWIGCFFSCCGLRVTTARFRLSPATHTHTNNTIYTHTIPIHTQAGRRAITNSVCFGFSFDAGFGFGLPNDPFVSVSESHMQTGLMCSCQIEMCTAHAAFVQHPLPHLPLQPFLGHLPICCPCTAGLKMFSIVWYIC